MKIEHIAIYTQNLEKMKDFYTTYFSGKSNGKYHNQSKQFSSYFISFDTGARLELMETPKFNHSQKLDCTGYHHIAITVGSETNVDTLTQNFKKDGYIVTEPRRTGDGYYESTVKDPDGNIIEITV